MSSSLPAPWSPAKPILQGAQVETQNKPAICDFNGRVFIAWATTSGTDTPASTFSFTSWLPSDDGWAPLSHAKLNDSTVQSNTSALVVFKEVLYAFVPWTSTTSSDSGLSIFKYNEVTFEHVGDWGETWNTPVTAVTHKGTLHVIGYNQSDSDHFVWTWSNPGQTTITGSEFSDNTRINQQSSSNPALVVRDDGVHLMFLAHGDGRGVLDITLIEDSNTWGPSVELNESGNSGISATATPDGKHAWICFKKHNGSSNLLCYWETKNNANCWSDNQSLGSGNILEGLNEAALVWSNDWIYAVWNTYQSDAPMYYSRRPTAQLYPDSWMGALVNQQISIADLSIPGTHDSATGVYHALVSEALVQCQNMGITEQLNAGIRYFDLRAGYDSDSPAPGSGSGPVAAFHGNWYLGLSFAEIFQFFYDWLDKHSTEGIIVQIKADQDDAKDQDVSNDVYGLISAQSKYWVTTGTIPTLDQIKGKIQLVRRVPLPDALDNKATSFGVNATNWPYNTASAVISHPTEDASQTNVSLVVEDYCTYEGDGDAALAYKTGVVNAFVDAAASSSGPAGAWYIGFSSYTTAGGLIPDSNYNYATKALGGNTPMNVALEQTVQSRGGVGNPARVGTLLMDYPDAPTGSLIDRIIYTNDIKL
ncbi:hypothetical protein G7Z17_g3618 [Cylindrodendrum hubeiense]|uniref:Phosphatidylinositol-specific phospholipase C X domain-containing protein n=1 Tax=Cylindrodendrum hubeiense TaxID=595255 RepID=A0A9P5HHK1_9HYPO|nr:hypothetical protein G7Z17_g3618 [Cylindrodendrum hubeiense]